MADVVELADVINKVGEIGLWLQALGLIVIIWIVFQLVAFFMNRKRLMEIYNIKKDMARIEGKINRILAKRK